LQQESFFFAQQPDFSFSEFPSFIAPPSGFLQHSFCSLQHALSGPQQFSVPESLQQASDFFILQHFFFSLQQSSFFTQHSFCFLQQGFPSPGTIVPENPEKVTNKLMSIKQILFFIFFLIICGDVIWIKLACVQHISLVIRIFFEFIIARFYVFNTTSGKILPL
jgi:hypothetical protein